MARSQSKSTMVIITIIIINTGIKSRALSSSTKCTLFKDLLFLKLNILRENRNKIKSMIYFPPTVTQKNIKLF